MSGNFDSLETIEEYLADSRWDSVSRDYDANGISSLRSPFKIVHTISEVGSKSLLSLLRRDDCWVSGLGAATTQQALQMFNLNYEIIYVSGWQVAAESNNDENTYPDLSLYPSNSTPNFIGKINNTLVRKISEHKKRALPPIVADAESGFGGVYSVFNLTSQFIKAGVSGIHFEDQLASEKKCGHMGGKVIIPTREYLKKLNSSLFPDFGVVFSSCVILGLFEFFAKNSIPTGSETDKLGLSSLTGVGDNCGELFAEETFKLLLLLTESIVTLLIPVSKFKFKSVIF